MYTFQQIILALIFGALLRPGGLQAQSGTDTNISRVPRYHFSSGEKEQEAQLRSNAFTERFARSRKSYAADRYRPLYHFVNPEGNLNDPNGLCFWKGNWHLFYQAYPPDDSRQHWGHAVSKDLLRWRDLPYAIYPGPEYQSFSGSTLVESDRVIAMYHGTRLGNMIATADDPLLLNWLKLAANPVIPIPGPGPSPYTVFDPCIWYSNGWYYSLSAGKRPAAEGQSTRADYLFRSKDLNSWEYMHEFVVNDRYTLPGDDGACPYFWPVGNRHILIFFSHMSGGQYLLGDYDTVKQVFLASSHGKFNFGAAAPAGVHAPSVTPDGKGGLIAIFNMNPGLKTKGWNQLMTLPRRLYLVNDSLRIEPAADTRPLHDKHFAVTGMTLPANKELVVPAVKGNVLELRAEIETRGASVIELKVLRSAGSEEYTKISFFPERGNHQGRPYETPRPQEWTYRYNSLIVLETSAASTVQGVQARPPEIAPVYLAPGEKLQLRIFIDRSVVEVFVNGKQCVAARVYPGRDDSNGFSIQSKGSDAALLSLDAWTMKTIYQ